MLVKFADRKRCRWWTGLKCLLKMIGFRLYVPSDAVHKHHARRCRPHQVWGSQPEAARRCHRATWIGAHSLQQRFKCVLGVDMAANARGM